MLCGLCGRRPQSAWIVSGCDAFAQNWPQPRKDIMSDSNKNSGRGMLTDEIVSKAREMLGDDIQFDTTSLRLMAYVQYVMINQQKIDHAKVNEDELLILWEWDAKEWISYSTAQGDISVSKKFWDVMSEILWLGYVIREQVENL